MHGTAPQTWHRILPGWSDDFHNPRNSRLAALLDAITGTNFKLPFPIQVQPF